ncbi:ubiquitin-conjugating enzyme/RWD-like protein [Hyaloraphidium curvatum]|nr:ubiquitin-conjugating enzyme/RWD-like protein [Hyaloraphidium curvatum]
MATKAAYKRLTKEYKSLQDNPPPFILARPLESNILEWHYVIRGPPDSPYAGGEYHGKLIFPSDYPFKPPAIKMLTPSGRFQIDFRLCLTMSDYHPNTWNPAWSVATILTGLLSFMLEDTPTTGSITTTAAEKRVLAQRSHAWNLQSAKFRDVFPELATPEMVPLEKCMPGSVSKMEAKSEEAKPAKQPSAPAVGNAPEKTDGQALPNGRSAPVPAEAGAGAHPAQPMRPLQERERGTSWASYLTYVLVAILGVVTYRVVARLREEL